MLKRKDRLDKRAGGMLNLSVLQKYKVSQEKHGIVERLHFWIS
jgi:hypothetical protein